MIVILRSTNGLAVDSTLNPNRPVSGKKRLPTFATEVLVFVPLDLASCSLNHTRIRLIVSASRLITLGTLRGLVFAINALVNASLGQQIRELITERDGVQLDLIKGLEGPILVFRTGQKIRRLLQQQPRLCLLISIHAVLQFAKTCAN
jgi:hypothetical protein